MAKALPEVPDLERTVGVEIEFGGLDPQDASRIVRGVLGGSLARTDEEYAWRIAGTALGDIEICLDTALGKDGSRLMKTIVELGRDFIPVEITSEPIPSGKLPALDALVSRLRDAGAQGTGSALLKSYGLHLNIAVAALEAGRVVPVVRAFALIEDWLRHVRPIEFSRRILPFVDPYPRSFLDRIARDGGSWDMDAFRDVYLAETPTRNRSLDMLPILAEYDRDAVDAALGHDARSVKARPAFHYRLADCRIGDADWSIAAEWHQWRLIEAVAARSDLVQALADAWTAYRFSLTSLPVDWVWQVDAMVRQAFGGTRAEAAP